MTNKIIIDGVDVSQCLSFDKLNGQNICCYDDTREDRIPFANFCVENKDCCFKQLKRKEKKQEVEVEQLKAKLSRYDEAFKQLEHSFVNSPYIDGRLADYYLEIIDNARERISNDK